MVAISLSRAVRIDSIDGGRGDWSTSNTPFPIFAAIVCKAATRYVRKRVGSLSPSSSDSQATGRSQPATHSLTSVVLPKPAEAEMRVSLRPEERPSFSRSIRRGRRTILDRGGGIYSFVAKIGVDIDQVYSISLKYEGG